MSGQSGFDFASREIVKLRAGPIRLPIFVARRASENCCLPRFPTLPLSRFPTFALSRSPRSTGTRLINFVKPIGLHLRHLGHTSVAPSNPQAKTVRRGTWGQHAQGVAAGHVMPPGGDFG